MSLRDQLEYSVDFVRKILLCLLPLPISFFRLFFPTLFAAALKDFLLLLTSLNSIATNSNMSTPMCFATGTTYLRKKGFVVLPKTCARAPNPLHVCLPTAL